MERSSLVNWVIKYSEFSNFPNKEIEILIREAIKQEYDGIRFYEYIVEVCNNEAVKNIVRNIISDEKTHVGNLLMAIKELDPKEYELYQEGIKEGIKETGLD